VGAKSEIYRLLHEARGRDVAVLVSSSEVPELLALCDRVLVMFRGRIVASLPRERATEGQVARFAGGEL
jgi:ribose transport system ATP-binding protein